MTARLVLCGAAAAASLAGPLAGAAGACPDAELAATPSTAPAVGDAIVCLVNAARAQESMPALRRVGALDASSLGHSRDMVARHYLSHQRRGRPTLLARIRHAGYFRRAAAGLYSENIGVVALETATAGTLVRAWLASPDHTANLLYRPFRDIGVGIAFAAPDPAFYPDRESVVVTTDFGRRWLARRPPRRRG